MDFMLANDWLQVINDAQQQNQENTPTAAIEAEKSTENKMDEDDDEGTLKILEEYDDEDDFISVTTQKEGDGKLASKNEEDDEKENRNIFGRQPMLKEKGRGGCKCRKEESSSWVPLIDHLCEKYQCSQKELQCLFCGLESRRQLIEYLKDEVMLKTSHLRPASHNFIVRCCDLTTQSSTIVPALGGYLNVTVRAYYYVKHGVKLRHPYFPCIIQYGGGRHQSYFPLEVLLVAPKILKKKAENKSDGI